MLVWVARRSAEVNTMTVQAAGAVKSRFFGGKGLAGQIKTEGDEPVEVAIHAVKREAGDDGGPTGVPTGVPTECAGGEEKRKKRRLAPDGSTSEQPGQPKNWQQIYELVRAMREKIVTPVDSMGCAMIPLTLHREYDQITPLEPKLFRFQLLVSLMLSAQTKDEVNYKAMRALVAYCKSVGFQDGLTVEAIMHIDEAKLDELIFSVGFHRRKAAFIKKAVVILHDKYHGDIPQTLEGLVELPGVGPKMAFLTLQAGWNLNVGIGVDTHVDRLAKMWGWVSKKCKNPEQTRLELEKWLPKQYWREINPLLVGFGQTICLPRGRRCDLCTLSKTRLCSNVDRSIIKRAENLSKEDYAKMNSTIRGDVSALIRDIEDLP